MSKEPMDFKRADSELADGLAVAVLVADAAGVVHFVNAAAEDLFGVSRKRAVGATLSELIVTEPDRLQHAREAVQSEEAFTAREIEITPLPNGPAQPLHADVAVTPWHSRQWGAVAIIEVSPLDRHLRIVREEALRAQEEANRTLLRGLAHEVRNPLAGLRGAAQLLEREVDAGLVEYTQVIVREADRLRALIDRMMAPDQRPNRGETNIHEVTEHVMQLLRAEAGPGVALTTAYDPSIPELQIDRDQIIQALLNLARNALQAIGDDGAITMRTRALRQYTIGQTLHRLVATIELIDNGPGIPEELQDHLFQPMVTGRPDGTGLGLTIAQSLVGRHDGLIECESSTAGTTFRILLPLEQNHG
ncbi:MAG: nitrogen regulation protein NR(II) [Halofilum sp. (in: g-proteobacteria)]